MGAPDTVTEATAMLFRDGYKADVVLVDGELLFDREGSSCPVGDAVVERMYRFEGPSDPGDEMVVFGLFDPVSGRRGSLASAFGLAADPEMMDHIADLSSRVTKR